MQLVHEVIEILNYVNEMMRACYCLTVQSIKKDRSYRCVCVGYTGVMFYNIKI